MKLTEKMPLKSESCQMCQIDRLNLTHSVLIQKEIIQEKKWKERSRLNWLLEIFTVFKSTRLAELRRF